MKQLDKISKHILMLVFMLPLSLIAQDRVIPNSEIPAAINTYVQTHFPDQTIVLTELDTDGLSKEYDLKLSDKTELTFNRKYQIKKIDGMTALPESVIPTDIKAYVSVNYPNNVITDWETERKRQEVKLDNGIELEFTLNGKFVRIDY